MKLFILFLCVIYCVYCKTYSDEQLIHSFNQDGYDKVEFFRFQNKRGIRSTSANVTLYSTKEYKRVYYMEGNSYQMGYLRGLMTCAESNVMLSEFLEFFIAELIDEDYARKHKDEQWFQLLIQMLTDMMKYGAYRAFKLEDFPKDFLDEMQGMVDACKIVLAEDLNYVTMERLATLAYGMDYILSHVYSGRLGETLIKDYLVGDRIKYKKEILDALDDPTFFKAPAYCDSFATQKSFNKDPSKVFFARDFQLVTGLVMNSMTSMFIYNPDASTGLNPYLSVATHGMVGTISGVNSKGVGIGVNILRSGDANADKVGMNGILLLKFVLSRANSTADGIKIVQEQKRGVPWIYPISDLSGHSVILETFQTRDEFLDPISLVPYKIRKFLPDQEYLKQHSPITWNRGVFLRDSNYSYPKEFLSYNEELFKQVGLPYPQSGWGDHDKVFQTYQEEDIKLVKIGSDYFPPLRISGDVIVSSNHAIIPQSRIMMMTRLADWLTSKAHSIQWRYDRLVEQLYEAKGKVDMDVAQDIITFLSPDRTPGYWHEQLDPTKPMTASVQGSIFVAELSEQIVRMKSGYWTDDFLTLQLRNYF